MYSYGTWKTPLQANPLASFINENIQKLLFRDPYSLPNLHLSPTIFLISDYSGEHAEADYQTISTIFTDIRSISIWESYRKYVRDRYLTNGRRMSFKQLRDQQRWQGLFPFLSAANNLNGLVATLGIHTSIDTLFDRSSIDLGDQQFQKLAHWSPKTLEKLFRVVHFNSIFLAGMAKPGQDVFWITDDDSIAPNVQRLTELTDIFANISSHYIPYSLGHLKVGVLSTVDEKEERRLEDIAAIPDLVSGAVAEILTLQRGSDQLVFEVPPSMYLPTERFSSRLILPQSKSFKVYQPGKTEIVSKQASMSAKTALILNWLGDSQRELRKAALAISPTLIGSEQLSYKWINFHSYNENHF